MVAFPPVPTNPKHDEWRAMVLEWAGLLQRIRLWEASNTRPPGEFWPELDAALDKLWLDWNPAIAQILSKYGGSARSAPEVFREMAFSKPVKEPVTLRKVQVRLSQGIKAGLWEPAGVSPERYALTDKGRELAAQQIPSGVGPVDVE